MAEEINLLEGMGIQLILGEDPEPIIDTQDLIILSPECTNRFRIYPEGKT